MQNYWPIIYKLYNITEPLGFSPEEMAPLTSRWGQLPPPLADFYRLAAKTPALQHGQDSWIMPENHAKWPWLQKSDHLIILNENQGVCQAGIRREDLTLPDPPVYVTADDCTWPECSWQLCAPSTTEFLLAALFYEAVFVLPYTTEDFYELTEENLAQIQARLQPYPFKMQNWLGDMQIELYHNGPEDLLVVLDMEGYQQMLYGTASQAAWWDFQAIIAKIGELSPL